MIEGLKVTVNGVELIGLCKARATWHRVKAGRYREQAKSYADLVENDQAFSNKTSRGDLASQANESAGKHESQGQEMDFLAGHINPDESYLLENADLFKLGIVSDRHY